MTTEIPILFDYPEKTLTTWTTVAFIAAALTMVPAIATTQRVFVNRSSVRWWGYTTLAIFILAIISLVVAPLKYYDQQNTYYEQNPQIIRALEDYGYSNIKETSDNTNNPDTNTATFTAQSPDCSSTVTIIHLKTEGDSNYLVRAICNTTKG